MSRSCALLTLATAAGLAAATAPSEARLLFTGDILLGRVVGLEIRRTERSPWESLRALFRRADLVVGNLESAVGRGEDCSPSVQPCLAASPASLGLLKQAGFRVLGLANNHAGDLGPEGIEAARRGLREAGLTPLGWEDSPLFVRAGAIATRTDARSSFPRLAEGGRALAIPCPVELAEPLSAGGWQVRAESSDRGVILEARRGERVAWRSWPLPLEGMAAARLAGPEGPEWLLTIERHPSPIDGELGLRPYVYQPGPRGLIPRWRGSALAWPLVDADLADGETLCALHRADSFLAPDRRAPATRVAAYRWNGFGFSGVEGARATARCVALFP